MSRRPWIATVLALALTSATAASCIIQTVPDPEPIPGASTASGEAGDAPYGEGVYGGASYGGGAYGGAAYGGSAYGGGVYGGGAYGGAYR